MSAATRLDSNKLIQLIEASRLGFITPNPSIISSSPDVIRQFYHEVDSDLAIKKIERGLIPYSDGSTGLLYTGRIPKESLKAEDFQRMRFVPVFLQRYIPKALELRVTVVGESVFACAIYSQEYKETTVDWRTQPFLEQQWLRHEPYDLSPDVKNKCIELTKRLNLTYFSRIKLVSCEYDYNHTHTAQV